MLDLFGAKKKILITGDPRGLGGEAVREFTGIGAQAAFFYHNSHSKSHEEAFNLSRETGALYIKCNVTNPDSVHSAMEVVNEYFSSEVDVLVCNSDMNYTGAVTELGTSRWREVIDSNLNGAYYCINEVLPGMISRGKGSIIIVSSICGQVGAAGKVAYSTAKAGLIGLTKSLAKEVGPSGIRVNCIAPGCIDYCNNDICEGEALDDISCDIPLGHMGTLEDVTKVMKFLASDESAFITGQIIGVNGGRL